METYPQTQGPAPGFPGVPGHRWIPDGEPLEECRTLLGILLKKTEALYRECRADREKETQIREMGSALASLAVLMNRMESPHHAIHEDNRGNTYRAVRSCDLDRFIDK